ncbi:ATP-binding protein [Faecalibacter rhinopitheci]|uniref:AAA family ATPase n=1 Tax=Faecalibacter rhinopitheci TaxID=2779678 RepID=A0A8J7FVK0_9FLAO|nr:SbcC/MukB-like Walker B domain-containing protein [Faecalibacter rhinopitheci]MBF0597146.1 AAA family ATPase [Faecalibacter rhinopitheci]
MLNLFSTTSDEAGFRLQYMEVYNWGTFTDRIFRIQPKGNNSLLTGANASGKSTFIDGLLTLLVPAKKDRFYNQSSGVDKKGDRTEETYVLGNYAHIQRDGDLGTLTKSLRDKTTYSIILAHFDNQDGKKITLFQARWFSNDELKRTFGIAHVPLTIEDDFSHFDQKGNWKKTLDKKYNTNTTKKKIELMDGPIAYGERMADLFGMKSSQSLTLFNQVVGVKVLEDLDEFIRTNMLEEWYAEAEFLQLKESFNTLMEAKINIEKVKDQLKFLAPINEHASKIQELNSKLETLTHSKDTAVFWFAQKGLHLANDEFNQANQKYEAFKTQLNGLKDKEAQLKDLETNLTVQIKSDNVGQQIEQIKIDLAKLEKVKADIEVKQTNYNQLVQILGLITDPNATDFQHNSVRIEEISVENHVKNEHLLEEIRLLKNQADRFVSEIKIAKEKIDFLASNQNNITGRIAEIRDLIVQEINASQAEIPFVAELIKIQNPEWEIAIESILHSFATQIIVPEKYLNQVENFIQQNDLNASIKILAYKGYTSIDGLKPQAAANHLIFQLDFKHESIYAKWIKDLIEQKFDAICNETTLTNQTTLLPNGTLVFSNGNIQKDDREENKRKENFILGWENTSKTQAIYEDLKTVENQLENINIQIQSSQKEIYLLDQIKETISKITNTFRDISVIDASNVIAEIEQKNRLIEVLNSGSNRTEGLQNELEIAQNALKELTEKDIYELNREIFKIETQIQQITKEINRNESILKTVEAVDISVFEEKHQELLAIDYYSIKLKQTEFQKELETQIKSLEYSKRLTEDKIKQKINEFKNPKEEIILKYKDWRSEASTLPDSSHLELASEYQDFYQKLNEDNLPRFETKFESYLQETIMNKIGDFRMFFENWSESIQENIALLNESLAEIDYNTKEYTTYIQLIANSHYIAEIQEFKSLLNRAISTGNDGLMLFEEKRDHFNEHIAPLIKKLNKEDWRAKVMDVRYWFNYKAEEFRRDNQEKVKTYEHMGALSGGEKAQLTYTILGSAIAYQFNLMRKEKSNTFRFIAIDEAFKAQDEDKAKYLLRLCEQLKLQLLVVTPADNIHIVEDHISFVHYVERKEEKYSWLYDMPITQYKAQKELFDI